MRSIALVALLLLPAGVERLIAKSNSRAAVQRGVEAFARGDYRAAERAFREAVAMRNSPTATFDLGTAQIAAGNPAEGSAALDQAVKTPEIAADAYYNRGVSALGSHAYPEAVRDFEETLRRRPFDAAAKRNLEIALRREQQRQQQNQQRQQNQPQQDGRDQQQSEREGEQGRPENDAESLLRSVEQQEREELSRMRRTRRGEPRIGW